MCFLHNLVIYGDDLRLFLSEEDRRWFMEAMQSQSVDVIKRMKEITQVMQTPEQVLVAQGVNPEDIEGTSIF